VARDEIGEPIENRLQFACLAGLYEAEMALILEGGRSEGAVSANGLVAGAYVHGLFGDDAQRRDWLERLGGNGSSLLYEAAIEGALDGLAAHLERCLDLDRLFSLAR
jgi:adenosylcobyric acid synthase